jgi:drug/metabolite transporter superfamily protein YnfA
MIARWLRGPAGRRLAAGVFIVAGSLVLAALHWNSLLAHWQAALAVGLLLGLLSSVFPLAQRIAPPRPAAALGESIPAPERPRLEDERLKLQNDIRGTFFQALAGLAVLIGAFLAWQQLQDGRERTQQTNSQVADQLKLTSQGQIAERFGRAIDQLGSGKPDVAVGGIYGLEQIFKRPDQRCEKPSTDPDVRRARVEIFEVLYAYIRVHAPWPPRPGPDGAPPPYPAGMPLNELPEMRIRAPDVQAALTVLGNRCFGIEEPDPILEDVDLRKARINGQWDYTHFARANVAGADFSARSDEAPAFLGNAKLANVKGIQSANFQGAHADRKTTTWPKGFRPADHGIINDP